MHFYVYEVNSLNRIFRRWYFPLWLVLLLPSFNWFKPWKLSLRKVQTRIVGLKFWHQGACCNSYYLKYGHTLVMSVLVDPVFLCYREIVVGPPVYKTCIHSKQQVNSWVCKIWGKWHLIQGYKTRSESIIIIIYRP